VCLFVQWEVHDQAGEYRILFYYYYLKGVFQYYFVYFINLKLSTCLDLHIYINGSCLKYTIAYYLLNICAIEQ